jgi:hypothetical protein
MCKLIARFSFFWIIVTVTDLSKNQNKYIYAVYNIVWQENKQELQEQNMV